MEPHFTNFTITVISVKNYQETEEDLGYASIGSEAESDEADALKVKVTKRKVLVSEDLPVRKRRRQREHQTEEQWEVAVAAYTNSVLSHALSSTGVNELHHLMSSVARQTRGESWQHPNNLTRRNYRQRLGDQTPLTPMAEWASSKYERFQDVAKTFERSPVL